MTECCGWNVQNLQKNYYNYGIFEINFNYFILFDLREIMTYLAVFIFICLVFKKGRRVFSEWRAFMYGRSFYKTIIWDRLCFGVWIFLEVLTSQDFERFLIAYRYDMAHYFPGVLYCWICLFWNFKVTFLLFASTTK